MKVDKDSIRLSKQEFETLLGDDTWICPKCGRLHPTWDWAQFNNDCQECNARPTCEEDAMAGKRSYATKTPGDHVKRFQGAPLPDGGAEWIAKRS